jgi:hypothetical protein
MRILWYNWRDIKHPDAGGAEVFTEGASRPIDLTIILFLSAFSIFQAFFSTYDYHSPI